MKFARTVSQQKQRLSVLMRVQDATTTSISSDEESQNREKEVDERILGEAHEAPSCNCTKQCWVVGMLTCIASACCLQCDSLAPLDRFVARAKSGKGLTGPREGGARADSDQEGQERARESRGTPTDLTISVPRSRHTQGTALGACCRTTLTKVTIRQAEPAARQSCMVFPVCTREVLGSPYAWGQWFLVAAFQEPDEAYGCLRGLLGALACLASSCMGLVATRGSGCQSTRRSRYLAQPNSAGLQFCSLHSHMVRLLLQQKGASLTFDENLGGGELGRLMNCCGN